MLNTEPDITKNFKNWFESLPISGGLSHVSTPRAFSHAEDAYDSQYALDQAMLNEGLGCIEILRQASCDEQGALLEIGCGTGFMSVGLVKSNYFPQVLITDPSPAFLRLTKDKIISNGLDSTSADFAVLTGEDMSLLPPNTFSAVVMRSVLHHVLDVPEFIKEVSRVLRPKGVLLCQEPIADGFTLMGTVASFFPLVAGEHGIRLTDIQRQQLELFRQTMHFQPRRDVNKSTAEDKHAFRPWELMEQAGSAGMSGRFFPNAGVDQFHPGAPSGTFGAFSLLTMLENYLKYCMNFGESFTPLFRGPLQKYLNLLDDLSQMGDGIAVSGIFIAQKEI